MSKQHIAAGIGFVCVLIGSFGLLIPYTRTHGTFLLPNTTAIVTRSTDSPSEKPVVADETYTVPNEQPRSIKIDSIQLNAYIQKVGIDQFGAVAVPSNINLAGWLATGVLPGAEGISIIDGHVHGKYAPGVFINLNKIKVGDKITIEFGDRTSKTFIVKQVKTVQEKDATKVLYEKLSDTDKQLNLITCGGTYDKDRKAYEDRVIISASYTDSP